ncbi:hypothetical protein [Larsenimonas salina]|uniref:hypothetical protein n=1 Tax=Larsenimonas salina TaxID=1295565 RepID=UPI00207389EB|nr:hypothetical protein [Larsenimonas salina]MCM5703845.1 hypothetical protein [Larsenimonas salina]
MFTLILSFWRSYKCRKLREHTEELNCQAAARLAAKADGQTPLSSSKEAIGSKSADVITDDEQPASSFYQRDISSSVVS